MTFDRRKLLKAILASDFVSYGIKLGCELEPVNKFDSKTVENCLVEYAKSIATAFLDTNVPRPNLDSSSWKKKWTQELRLLMDPDACFVKHISIFTRGLSKDILRCLPGTKKPSAKHQIFAGFIEKLTMTVFQVASLLVHKLDLELLDPSDEEAGKLLVKGLRNAGFQVAEPIYASSDDPADAATEILLRLNS